MNKIFKLIIFVSIGILFISCGSVSNDIKFKQGATNYNVILRKTKDTENLIIKIQFPNKITITNNSFSSETFITLDYKYDNVPTGRDLHIGLFSQEGNVLMKTTNNSRKTIPSNKSLEYVYYTRHFVESTEAIQQQFKPYVQEMLEENKDTLHIGTVSDFKKNHKELFERLTKNDSISVQFLDGNKFGERISVPVEW
ncbi:hypothetical protein I2486_09905 [Cellulophaga sp. E16_2]|uniref:hypothetical protein n=1 Tax=Cellulophaga sp. E16_2 TaxID=2789297 RepID=UPI001A92602F|nr:hypothetical protein [Cellulophaga sp. E16_2]MBO0591720.1 hypothetical protein [Cellulophaga sp. E16_2]